MKNAMRRIHVFLLLAVLAVVGCTGSQAEALEIPIIGKAELNTMLSANKGKVIFLNFWTTWCPSCKEELPELEKFARTMDKEKSALLAISLDQNRDALLKYFKETPAFELYHGKVEIAGVYGVQAIPHMVVIDPEGKVAFSKPGVFPLEMMQRVMESMGK